MSAAAAAGIALGPAMSVAPASASADTPYRIDIHAHAALLPAVKQWLVAHNALPPGLPPTVWDGATALGVMDANKIALAVLSAPMPDTTFRDEAEAREIARISNDAHAEVVNANATRFGFFGYLPLPYVNAGLDEISYVLDTLGADGVTMTAHAGGRYLGDPMFDPVLEELNRRQAVIFTHPFPLPGGPPAPGIPPLLADFLLDTTRAAVLMILNGVLDRYPDLKIILPHGGGFLPYLGSRLKLGTYFGTGVDSDTVARSLGRFYYDTAMWTSPYATPSLLRAAETEHILYGSDYNALPAAGVAEAAGALDTDPCITPPLHWRIARANALDLLPSLARRLSRPSA